MRRRAPAWPLLALVPLCGGWDPWKSQNRVVEEGNARMRAGQAKEALEAYDRAARKVPASDPALHFNRGAALSALGKHDQAGQEFLRATEAKDPSLRGAAFYNLGNSFVRRNQLKEAIEAYKRSLGVNPKDERTKWNLELALRRKQEEEKKQKDDQNNGDKDKDDKKQDDKKQDDKNQDQAKNEGQEKDDKDRQQPEAQKPQPQDQKKAEQKDGKPPEPEQPEVEAWLDSLDEAKNLEKERVRMRAKRRAPAKDW